MTAAEVTVMCPACAAEKHSRSEVYEFARAYLCELHRKVWDAADASAHRRLEERAIEGRDRKGEHHEG